jgi:DNA-binding IclR family transcriptional regulator
VARQELNLNSTGRAVAIIEFLASRPTETFSISEIARRLNLNKSTAFTAIRTLHGAGWLFRSPTDRRYALGPKLTVVGQAASDALPHVTLARPVMERLAAELRRECDLATLTGDEILVLHTTGPPNLGQHWTRPGDRRPFVAPFGTVFVAWQDEAAQKEWLERGAVVDPEESAELVAALEAIHKRGFVATLRSPLSSQWTLALQLQEVPDSFSGSYWRQVLSGHSDQPEAGQLMSDPGEAADPPVIYSIQAPIFEHGEPRYSLTVPNLEQKLDAANLAHLGKRVRSACDEITRAIAQMS